jgi:hypothetical protein
MWRIITISPVTNTAAMIAGNGSTPNSRSLPSAKKVSRNAVSAVARLPV